MTFDEFTAQVEEAQKAYNAAKAANDEEGMKEALAPLDETGSFWIVPLETVLRADFTHDDKDPEDVVLDLDLPNVMAMDGPAEEKPPLSNPAAYDQIERPKLPNVAFQVDDANAQFLGEAAEAALAVYMKNGSFPRHLAYLAASEADSGFIDTGAPFDQ